MKQIIKSIQQYATQIVSIIVILTLFGFARLPTLSTTERQTLSNNFKFSQWALAELSDYPTKHVRQVHSSLKHISAWMSAVGAAVALHDLDNDGLANDICYVDPRIDQVIIAPAPTTPARYAPFTLTAPNLPYTPATTAPAGCLPSDFNEDGLPDILVYYLGRSPIIFLHKTTVDTAQKLNLNYYLPIELVEDATPWDTTAATVADLDGDGHMDLIIANYFQDEAEIYNVTNTEPQYMQHSMSRAYNGGRNRIFLWQQATTGNSPSVTFKQIEGILSDEVAHAWTLAVGAADLNGDLLPEIYFANDFGPDRLLYNQSTPGQLNFSVLNGVKTLTTPNSKVLGQDSFKGMGIDFADLNQDGLFDMYVSNIAADYALHESHFVFINTGNLQQMANGLAPFVDKSESLGMSRSSWGWDTRFGDFNNDGTLEALQATGFVKGQVDRWPELQEMAMANDELLSNPAIWLRVQPGDDVSGHAHNPFFVKSSSGRYYDLATDLNLNQPYVSRGIATADIEGDGDLDFVIANQWETSYLYLNQSPNPGAFLGLHLLHPVKSNQPSPTQQHIGHPTPTDYGYPAIGALATVSLATGQTLVAQVDGGNGHSGVRSPDLHFGLNNAPANKPLAVNLKWRDATGAKHEQTLELKPGWHTIILASN